ncbi:MAG: ribosome biogenesis GTPase Der [Bacteroidales bacterium]|jgi:GTP-binding protein|nr:ribosome biogenesis GTPase Der [Bacteroidales bacterium]
MGNIVAIVGRPNVGKSTLFNRLTGMRQAIVDPTSGVTRDRHYGTSDWNGVSFSVIDTGGYIEGSDDIFEEEIRKQAKLAIEEADVILFMVNTSEGLTSMDEDVVNLLRRSDKPVFVAANKVDDSIHHINTHEFYALGLSEIYPISAMNGHGTGDLLDAMVQVMNPDEEENIEENIPRIAVVGRPNVGKSSLINALIGVERNIVTPIAGTTRDSILTRYKSFGFDFYMVDTAGIRKKGKVKENIDFYSVMRSIRAIENSDVCMLMISAEDGFEGQDANILQLIEKNRKGLVIVVNKWDAIEKDSNTHLAYERQIRAKIAPFTDVPIVFTSVINKQRIIKTLEACNDVYKRYRQRISTAKLNEELLPIVKDNPPPAIKGKYVRIKYITMLPTKFPAFVFFCNLPQYVKDPYKRFIENKLREMYDFTGVPIQIYFREK